MITVLFKLNHINLLVYIDVYFRANATEMAISFYDENAINKQRETIK